MPSSLTDALVQSTCGVLPLTVLKARECGVVHELAGPGDYVRRMREIGLFEGARIEMVRPGSSCVVKVAEKNLSLRCGDVQVFVQRG